MTPRDFFLTPRDHSQKQFLASGFPLKGNHCKKKKINKYHIQIVTVLENVNIKGEF
jgi:hypothetical protein